MPHKADVPILQAELEDTFVDLEMSRSARASFYPIS